MNRRSFFQTVLGVIGGVVAAFAKKDDFPKQSKIKGSSQNLIIFDDDIINFGDADDITLTWTEEETEQKFDYQEIYYTY